VFQKVNTHTHTIHTHTHTQSYQILPLTATLLVASVSGACEIVRVAARMAWDKHGRAQLATDVLAGELVKLIIGCWFELIGCLEVGAAMAVLHPPVLETNSKYTL
jgi:hypothetical protein